MTFLRKDEEKGEKDTVNKRSIFYFKFLETFFQKGIDF